MYKVFAMKESVTAQECLRQWEQSVFVLKGGLTSLSQHL